MILQLERPIVFLDLETTGLEVNRDRIVEIGLVKLLPDGSRQALVERVDPGIDIPDTATRVHGIRNDEVRGLFGKPRLPRVAKRLIEMLEGSDLGGFNCKGFDLPMWRHECERHQIPFDPRGRRVIDAKLVFNAREPGWDRFLMGPRTLAAAVRHYCGKDLPNAHSAEADAGAAIDVLYAQLSRYPDMPRDVQGLHDYCETLSQRQQEDERVALAATERRP